MFSRWCQVVFRFEMALYDNPEQDLNRVWWDLVEKYQEVKRPEGRNQPDYASKIHIATAPVYYQSYMLGQLFASQVHHAIARDVLHALTRRRPFTWAIRRSAASCASGSSRPAARWTGTSSRGTPPARS